MDTINSTDAWPRLQVIWRPEDAQKIAHYVKFALEDGTVNLTGAGEIDFKKITEELVITIYEAFINEDKDFNAWLQAAPLEVSAPELQEYFMTPPLQAGSLTVYYQELALGPAQAQLLYQYINYHQEKNKNSSEPIVENSKLAALTVQNFVTTYVNTDRDFSSWWHQNPEKLKTIKLRDCFNVTA